MSGYTRLKYLRKECKAKNGCIYLTIKPMYDISDKLFQVWYCSCEDEMCAGCIPTYKK